MMLEKSVHINRAGKRKVYIGPRLARAAMEQAFISDRTNIFFDKENMEELKPMTPKRKRGRRCEICHAKPMRGKAQCAECAKMSPEAQRIVRDISPVVLLKVDTRYRWITGNISLTMDQ